MMEWKIKHQNWTYSSHRKFPWAIMITPTCVIRLQERYVRLSASNFMEGNWKIPIYTANIVGCLNFEWITRSFKLAGHGPKFTKNDKIRIKLLHKKRGISSSLSQWKWSLKVLVKTKAISPKFNSEYHDDISVNYGMLKITGLALPISFATDVTYYHLVL